MNQIHQGVMNPKENIREDLKFKNKMFERNF